MLLLRDIAELLETRKGDGIGSADLCEALCALEESPWAEWRRGSPITTRGIAKLLKPFGIHPTRDRTGRFYRLPDFTDALARYVSDTPVLSDTSVTEKHNENNGVTLGVACDACGERDACKCHTKPSEGEF